MKWFVSWSCALLSAFMAFGAEVSSEEARRAVGAWVALDGPMGCPAVASGVMADVRTYEGKDGVGKFHVTSFKKADGSSGGYVVTSAETTLTPILAYSDDGEFIESDENPLWVMLTFDVKAVTEVAQRQKGKVVVNAGSGKVGTLSERFSENEMRWAKLLDESTLSKLTVSSSSRDSAPSDLRVDKLLETTWGQSTVYTGDGTSYNCFNLYTPLNRVCGCVATAGGQIMYYHKWPTSSISATKDYGGVVTGIGDWSIYNGYQTTGGYYTSWNPSFGGTYAWNTMSTQTAAGRQAIAKLTRDVGLSCYMEYGVSQSSASYYVFPVRLLDQFGYANAKFIVGGSHDQNMKGLLASLDAKLPVGVSVPGHAIIADGYGYQSETLYVHFNLGWSGSCDAWYNPPDLTDADYDFTSINTVIYNIYPPRTAAANCTIVSGRVLGLTGAAISSVTVTARNRTTGAAVTANTDAKGIYALFLPAADYTISVNKDGSSASTDLTVLECVSTSLVEGNETSYYVGTGSVNNMYGVDLYLDGTVPPTPSDEYGLDTTLSLTTGGNANWFKQTSATHDGVDAAQSGSIGNNGTTWLETTVNGPCDISFWWKVSSESGYDYLRFYIDDIEQSGSISGEVDWMKMSYALSTGSHRLKWAYTKDGSQLGGSDCGWVDQLQVQTQSRIWTVKYHKNTTTGIDITRSQNFYKGQSQRLLYLDSQLKWTLKDGDGFSYTFLGWAKSPSGAPVYANGESLCDLVEPGKVLHLYAVWQKRAYNVTFHSNDGRNMTGNQEFRPGIAKNLLWLDSGLGWTRSGYDFLGWAKSSTGGSVYENGALVQDVASQGETLHLYAVWRERKWTVCFHKNDGTGSDTTTSRIFRVGVSERLPWLDSGLRWTRPDFNFKGWAKSPTGNVVYENGAVVKDLVDVGRTLHLYAKWESKYATYTIRYHKNDGTTEVANQTFRVGERKSLCWMDSILQWSVNVAGYRCSFLGWAKSPIGDIAYSNGQVVSDLASSGAVLHLYAVWRVNFVESNCSNLASNKLLCYSAGVANQKECGTVRTKDGGQIVFDDSGALLMMFEPDGTEHVIEGRFVMPAGVLKR